MFHTLALDSSIQPLGGVAVRKCVLRAIVILIVGTCPAQGRAAPNQPLPHAPITISSDADFATCACVVRGDGSAAAPYQIGPWKIDDLSLGYAVKITGGHNISKYFALVGITSNPPAGSVAPDSAVIWIAAVTLPTTVQGTTANAAGTGVRITDSLHIRLDGSNLNKMLGNGHVVIGSSDIVVTNSKLKAEQSGMVLIDSSHVRIGADGRCAQPYSCNDFTYDEAYGLFILNSSDVLVEGLNAAANDTAGIVLSGSGTSRVEIRFSQVSGNGPICHTVQPSRERVHTGLEVDHNGGIVLINGAHDNYIHDNNVHADTGFDLRSGGNGTFVDPCTGAVIAIVPASAPMGLDNQFSPGPNCYSTTNISPAPPKANKCAGG